MTENKRIIKFRAGDGGNFYSPFIGRSGKIARTLDDYSNGIFADDTIMQFTGLLDRNGKEIYEGDIIRGKNGKLWVIEWKDYGWCINNHLIADPKAKFAGPETYGFAYWMRLHPEGHCDVEIIGSLYENPELIKS